VLTCPAPPAALGPPADRPRYELNVHVRSDLKEVDGDLTVRFTADRPTSRLVFRLWPDGPRQLRAGMRLDVGRPTGPTLRGTSRPDPTTLVVRTTTIAPGGSVTVHMPWRLRVPRGGIDRIGRWRDGVRLGSFFPILAWDPRRGWATDPPTRLLAETSTSPTAEFDVHLSAPHGLTPIVSGTQVGPGRWHAHAVRDVGLAVGRFAVKTAVVAAPNPVVVRVAVSDRADDATEILKDATFALRTFARKYGAYRWSTYSLVATPDLFDTGIEYPTLSFIGRASSLLRPIVVHESAHQWFYSLVGDNQARDPWLDEGLASWAELVADGGLRYQLEALPAVQRHAGASVRFFGTDEDRYSREVYGGGVQALASLGPVARVDCALRLYTAENAYRIAHPSDLLDAFSRVFPDVRRRLRRFGIRG
jgi:peptidase M1-like protein